MARPYVTFGIVGLEHDTALLEALADSLQKEFDGGGGGGGGGGSGGGGGGLRDALAAPRSFIRLLAGGDSAVTWQL